MPELSSSSVRGSLDVLGFRLNIPFTGILRCGLDSIKEQTVAFAVTAIHHALERSIVSSPDDLGCPSDTTIGVRRSPAPPDTYDLDLLDRDRTRSTDISLGISHGQRIMARLHSNWYDEVDLIYAGEARREARE